MFNALIYNPLYNALIALIDLIPGGDVGLAVILLTIIVRLILFPLSQKAARTQLVMRTVQPQIDALKKKFKDSPQAQATETMALYKKEGINPFASIGVLIIQLPIIFGLYFIFLRGGLPMLDMEILYDVTPIPGAIDMQLFGVFDVAARSFVFAFLAGASQFVQIRLVSPKLGKRAKNSGFKDDMMRSMQLQMRYVMPVIVAVIAYTLPATIGVYWTTSNLFMIFQELYTRKKFYKDPSTSFTELETETESSRKS